ncbi:HNH endonuclease [Brachybacterium sp. JHP9]|uniref:HNH endonuclease n=1 Tax=Brachybacterium equifaecis TaxID=2910770 RepID=A0ABT0R362_9MICO|nr:HNH endonuclease signature motif containing protein [Brachybacterium equifaecis]MCL6424372.1 HNH endonuclease [Brachybacterium equifaecis]
MPGLIQFLLEHPGVLIGALLIAAVAIAAAVSALRPGEGMRDPVRMYSAEQRREGFDRAGHRCEMSTFGILRCQRPAQHADHFWPWSRGGATSMRNLVAACSRHNTSKGASMPSSWTRRRITRRRAHYFPEEAARIPGQWYAG